MNTSRIEKLEKALIAVARALVIARAGISSANKKNAFWSKSEAFKSLNIARKNAQKLYNIFELECKLLTFGEIK